MSKVISLVSGGPDSILATYKLLEEGNEVVMFFADLGQQAVEQEYKAVTDFLSVFDEKYPGKVDFSRIRIDLNIGKSIESTWWRIAMLVGCAITYSYNCWNNEYGIIAHGSHYGDFSPGSDPAHIEQFGDLIKESTGGRFEIVQPIKDYNLKDIGQAFKDRDLPLDRTYNCLWSIPCGYRSPNDTYRCQGCRRKIESMIAAGYSREEYEMPNSKVRSFQDPLVDGKHEQMFPDAESFKLITEGKGRE